MYSINATDDLKARAIHVFNAADKDGSGTIDERELYSLLRQIYPNITLPESNKLYHEMDLNRSGKTGKFLTEINPFADCYFSGSITIDEFTEALMKYKWDTSNVYKEKSRESTYEWEIPYNELKFEKKLGEGILRMNSSEN